MTSISTGRNGAGYSSGNNVTEVSESSVVDVVDSGSVVAVDEEEDDLPDREDVDEDDVPGRGDVDEDDGTALGVLPLPPAVGEGTKRRLHARVERPAAPLDAVRHAAAPQ